MTQGFEGLRLPDSNTPEVRQNNMDARMLRRIDNRVNQMIADPTKFRLEQPKQSWNMFALAQQTMKAKLPTTFSKTRDPSEVKEIEKILSRLQEIKDIKKDDTLSALAKDYVYIMETKDQQGKAVENMSFVKVNIQQVTDDINLLQNAKKAFPESVAQLNGMIQALSALRASDPHGAAQWLAANVRANTPTNEALAYAGKLGGVVLLGGATALSGIMSLATKQVSSAPLIYGGLMMYILNPDFLTGKNRNQIMESAPLLNNDRFVYTLAPKYNMQGKDWGTAIETLFSMYGKNHKALLAYQANPSSPETIKNLADELVPALGSPAHKNVMRLLQNKPDFDDVLNMMKPITSKETIQLVTGYVNNGSWRYARRVDANGFAKTQKPEVFPGLKVPDGPT